MVDTRQDQRWSWLRVRFHRGGVILEPVFIDKVSFRSVRPASRRPRRLESHNAYEFPTRSVSKGRYGQRGTTHDSMCSEASGSLRASRYYSILRS